MSQYFSKEFNQFFIELAANNHKDWFHANKNRYESHVKGTFHKFVEDLITELSTLDKALSELKNSDCIFRINKDIRFSKDKSPYKTHMSALISPNGKKDMGPAGIYIEFSPEHLRVYRGAYMLSTTEILKIRTSILENNKEFDKIISEKDFVKNFGEVKGEKSKKISKEFQDIAKIQPLIFNKQFYVFTQKKANFISSKELMKWVVENYKITQKFSEYLTNSLLK